MDIVLAALVVTAAVAAWTWWETTMVARLTADTRPLVARNAAVAGAHRLTTVAQVALVAVAVVAAQLTATPLWSREVALARPDVGVVLTLVLVALAAGAVWWSFRRGPAPQDRRALTAVGATALATEVLLRGLGLGLLDRAGSPVTVAVLVVALATGLLQAARATPGSRAYGFVLATVLGFVLGLVVVVTGYVLAAAAIAVTVSVLDLARTFPDRSHPAGCACGGSHTHDAPAEQATRPAAAAPASTTAAGHDPASCGSACGHAGTSACVTCPLSTARV